MNAWSPTTLAQVDDEYDRQRADQGAALDSRFGQYLAARTSELYEDERTDPTEFAMWAWRTATPPVMSPGYVRLRPDLQVVRLVRSEEDGALAAEVGVPLWHNALKARVPYSVGDWEEDRYSLGEGDYCAQLPPRNEKNPAVLLSALLRVPAGDWRLHQPGDWTALEELLVDDAKQAVAVLVEHINREIGPKVATLRSSEGGSW